MKITLMNSGIHMLRLFLTIFLFQVLVSAQSANNDFKFKSSGIADFQNLTVNFDQHESIVLPNSGQIIAPPVINLTVSTSLLRIAVLTWTTTDPTLQGTYHILRNAASAGWIDIKTLPYTTLVFNDTISYPFCIPTNFAYQVSFVANVNASDNATSSQVAASFPLSDLTAPANVSNLSVVLSNTPGGFAPGISWDRITNDDISAYEVQRFDPLSGSWPVIASGTPALNNFNDATASPVCGSSFKYIVRTTDMCGIPSAPDYVNKYVQTINLNVAHPGQCDKSARLTWNSYKNMIDGLGGYKIYRTDGGIPVEINPIQPTDTSYIDNFNFVNGRTYGYSVKAYSNISSFTSSSCEVFQQYNGATLPDTVYITQVGVENDSYVSVKYYITPDGSASKLFLERSDDNGSTFHTIDSIVSPVPQRYYFNDTTADIQSQTYYYRIAAIDDCGGKTMSINTLQSIWLQCSKTETENILNWNRYKNWLQGVEGYEIYRILDNETATIKIIGNVDPTTVSFPDLLTNFDPMKMPCYWVEAIEKPGNPYLQNAVSKSNTCCVIKDPVLFLPNAFYPDGTNKLFRPVPKFSFVNKESFRMTIFSRWGQQLFETSDIDKGWDGSVNGQFIPAGQYAYLITYKSTEGKDYKKRGTVMLVR
jgi:gliding motility-associated-like protein